MYSIVGEGCFSEAAERRVPFLSSLLAYLFIEYLRPLIFRVIVYTWVFISAILFILFGFLSLVFMNCLGSIYFSPVTTWVSLFSSVSIIPSSIILKYGSVIINSFSLVLLWVGFISL